MRIGVFGGTFDPPHMGHMILASEACDQLNLAKVLWVLTAAPPHKLNQFISSVEIRLELLRTALCTSECFEVSRVDIDRPGPHYALHTVQRLKSEYPDDEIIYLMGGDSLHDLPLWYEAEKFVDATAGIGVMRRPEDDIDLKRLQAVIPNIVEKTSFIHAPLLQISSHEIRKRIAQGRTFRYYLPGDVYALIQEKGYYR